MTRTMTAVLALSAGVAAASDQADFWLTVLHNNDAESQLLGASGQPEFGGVARFATLVAELRTEAQTFPAGGNGRGSLLISAGDNILAGPEFAASLALPEDQLYYDAIGLRLIGYDVLGTGNHEFDFNPDVFGRLVEDVNPAGTADGDLIPFVSANLDFSNEPGLGVLQPARLASSAVKVVDGRPVGVIGATTESLPFISSPRDVIVNAVAPAVQTEIDALRGMGVEIIILTSHLQSVDEELALAAQLRGLDAIIAGGGDDIIADTGTELVPGDSIDREGYPLTATDPDGRTVYVVSTAGDYKYVGRLILGFDASGEVVEVPAESNIVRVASTTADAANGVEANADVQTQVVDPVQAAVDELASNLFAATEVPLDGVRGNIRSRETNLGNLITDAYLATAADLGVSGNTVISIANGGGIRNNNVIPVGPLSELDTFDILPFSNFITAIEPLPAVQVKELLENGVSRIEAGTGNAVGGGTGRFAQVGGIRFSYDARRQAIDFDSDGNTIVEGQRVREAVLADGTVIIAGGRVLPGAPDITVVTADFTARGGDEFPFRGAAFDVLGVSYQQSLFNYIESLPSATVAAADYPEGGEGRVVNLESGELLVQCNPADVFAPFGEIDVLDFYAFPRLLVTQSPAADIAEPFGEIDIFDLLAFFDGMAEGCE